MPAEPACFAAFQNCRWSVKVSDLEMLCRVCESQTEEFGAQTILGRFEARYRRCKRCGFVFVARATWLDIAYSSAIAQSDTGIAVRNLELADQVSLLISLAFNDAKRFLDFGGGSGLFVRLLRDRGFDFRLSDKYATNLFAGGFEAQPGETVDLCTCLEVAEHLVEPMPTFTELGRISQAIVLSTELLPMTGNRPGEWWYYAPETGQHVSFYSIPALRVIADRLQMHFVSNGTNFHVLSRRPVSRSLLNWVTSRRWRGLARMGVRVLRRKRRPLTWSDAESFRRKFSEGTARD